MSEAAYQIILFLIQAVTWSGVLVLAYSASRSFGLIVIYLMVGAVQMMQTLLVLTLYVEVVPGVLISPGSMVLFSGTLFAVLLVHIIRGPIEARRLIYGVFAVNCFLSLMMIVAGRQFESHLAVTLLGMSSEIFFMSAKTIMIGSGLLLIDVILIVAIYEYFGRFRIPVFLRMFGTLLLTLTLDGFLFYAINFQGSELWSTLAPALAGKAAVSVIYSASLAYAFKRFPSEHRSLGFSRMLAFLTFRSDVEKLVRETETDELTGTFSRRYLSNVIPEIVKSEMKSGNPLSVLMVDVDYFKRINDEYGHAMGDRVLVIIARELMRVVRNGDAVCRYGGEEFSVIMPNIDRASTIKVAERIRKSISQCPKRFSELSNLKQLSVSIGVAFGPYESVELDQLIDLADQRLYEAKNAGRDLVVASD